MAKKYLSLDEVTDRLGMSADQVNKLREAGKLRGFADRGTWKFKSEEIDEYARASQVDSDPEVPIFDGGSSILGLDDLDLSGSSATIVKGSSIDYDAGTPGGSDSDVRLILDESISGVGVGDSALDVSVKAGEGSDSDVRLTDSGSGKAKKAGSDSDVRLAPETVSVAGGDDAGSDSDVKVVDDAGPSSDSGGDFDFSDDDTPDVKTAPEISTKPADDLFDSTDTDMPIQPAAAAGGSEVIADEPAKTESSGADVFSGIDSGISLADGSGPQAAADSGIALDSGEADRGGSAVLDEDDDDGIALFDDDEASASSGIGVKKPSDSGIALEGLLGDDADAGQTVSMDALSDDDIDKLDGGATGDTELEIAALSPDEMGDSEFDIDVADTVGEAGGAALSAAAAGATMEMSDVDAPAGDVHASDTFEMEGNSLEESFEELAADDDEFADDDFGDEDVFDADDGDFEGDYQSGESVGEFGAAPRAAVAAGDYDFGTPAFVGLVATSCVLAVGAMVMVDLMRSIWAYREPSVGTSAILDAVKDLF